MAIHAVCEFCGHRLSVPDDLKGKRISCPSCDRKTRVVTGLDLSVEDARRKHQEHTAGKPAEKLEAPTPGEKERLGTVAPGGTGQTAPPRAQPGSRTEPPVQPGSDPTPAAAAAAPLTPVSRYPALRAFGAAFTFLAYLVGAFGVAVGIILFLSDDTQTGLLMLLGCFVGSVIAFSIFKLLAHLSRLGADMGENEARMLRILQELRDGLDRLKK